MGGKVKPIIDVNLFCFFKNHLSIFEVARGHFWIYLSRLEQLPTQTYYQRGLSKSSVSVSAVFAGGSGSGEGARLSVSIHI